MGMIKDRGRVARTAMGLLELFVAVLIVGLSAVNAAVPAVAFSRTRDPRFVLLVGANLGLLALGGLWAWGELPVGPPSYSAVSLPVLGLAALVVLFLFGTVLLPRRAR
ncbi:MAG: hypothetical protein L3K19_02795 [Thermoplasmata archaeon]|nr:hypothetical protein [Thermoplasmata archaeon]